MSEERTHIRTLRDLEQTAEVALKVDLTKATQERHTVTHESLKTKEQIVVLPLAIHDVSSHHIATLDPRYKPGPLDQVFMYHDAHKEKGNDGHVGNLSRFARLYLAVVHHSLLEQQNEGHSSGEYPQFPPERNAKVDPLQIYESAHRYLLLDPDLADVWITTETPERQKQLIDLSLLTSANMHDLGNTTKDVNWGLLKATKSLAGTITPHAHMHFHQAEENSARMYRDYIDTFKAELGLTEDEAAIVSRLGSMFIEQTVFDPNFVSGLAVLDQTAAILKPNALRGVFGLLNESQIRLDYEKDSSSKGFRKNDFFGGFIDWRLEVMEASQQSATRGNFLNLIEGYLHEEPSKFAHIMGVNEKDLKEIDDLDSFIHQRVEIQKGVASLLWPDGKWDQTQEIPFRDAFEGWTEVDYHFMQQASEVFHDRFWDSSLSLEDFTRLWDQLHLQNA